MKEQDKTPNTLRDQAWKRATENKKPKAGTPHDWEDYEKSKKKKPKIDYGPKYEGPWGKDLGLT